MPFDICESSNVTRRVSQDAGSMQAGRVSQDAGSMQAGSVYGLSVIARRSSEIFDEDDLLVELTNWMQLIERSTARWSQ
jgi:hypothetical protein